jgi:hypothetical protein
MKKAILTFGLFSMMMVLTSFTGSDGQVTDVQFQSFDTGGGASIGAGKKLDYAIYIETSIQRDYDTGGGASIGAGKKLD